MKKREPLIFSEQFFRGVDEAVAGAVASSKAAGLPKAYLDSYDQLPAKPVEERLKKPSSYSGGNSRVH